MGGSGVQRWLKTSKYLRDFNWEPIICTAKDPEISMFDKSLESEIPENLEVLRIPIWEPFKLYRLLTGRKTEKINPGFLKTSNKESIFEALSIWVRGNLFIPDAKRFWISPATKKLSKYLKKNKVDIIVSTGPPHTTHLIAMQVSKKFNIPWLADFRDPWTKIDFYHKLNLSRRADKTHKKLELEVLNNANEITTVSESWSNDFLNLSHRKPIVINNGFDPVDFERKQQLKLDQNFTITHAGSMNFDRNHEIFWKSLSFLIQDNLQFKNDLKINLIGPIDISVTKSIKKYNLNDHVFCIDNLDHNMVIDKLITSQLLFLPLNNTPNVSGIIPGKTYEYIAAKRPILCIGDINGDTSKILNKTNSGTVVGFEDLKLIYNELLSFYNLYKIGRLNIDSNNYNMYSRKELAKKFAMLFNDICK